MKMKDYTSNNYCDFLWINDLLQLKRNTNNEFILNNKKNQRPARISISNVVIFGTIVEIKQVGEKDFLYQVDDGTGVIACKHSISQFEEMIGLIENEQMDIMNHTLESQQSFELTLTTDISADDSVFNDRSIQSEELSINKKSRLKGLVSIWDDIYKSFYCLIQPYTVGDFVVIQGKLYTYFNVNQIYINSTRIVDLEEEIMLLALKLEDSFHQLKETPNLKIQSDAEKRLSGMITFDNIPHLNPNISNPRNIKIPKIQNEVLNSIPEIVTPNLEPTITYDTFNK